MPSSTSRTRSPARSAPSAASSCGPTARSRGTNNDCFGFIHSLREELPDWRADAGPAVVIGAGGGARAVVYGLARGGRARDPARQPDICAGDGAGATSSAVRSALCPGTVATTRWRTPRCSSTRRARAWSGSLRSTCSWTACRRQALVADIIYIPRETPLLAAAQRRGHRTLNGLGMLLHQARPAWQAWFGVETQVTPELRALLEATL